MVNSPFRIRPLLQDDIPEADAILSLAFNTPKSRVIDLGLYLQMQPDGWFVAENREGLAGMVGAVRQGSLAHVGFMAVRPRCQRLGIGMALMAHLLADLEQKGLSRITLDASQAGKGLYEKLGFANLGVTVSFAKLAHNLEGSLPAGVEPILARHLDELAEWDAPFFGANRRKILEILLQAYPDRAFIQRSRQGRLLGYVFAQLNRVGPWVAVDSTAAENLIKAALALPFKEETIMTAVPGENLSAIEMVRRYGFLTQQNNQRMIKGPDPNPGQREMIYAQTSFAVG